MILTTTIKNGKAKRAAIYARVSTDGWGEPYDGDTEMQVAPHTIMRSLLQVEDRKNRLGGRTLFNRPKINNFAPTFHSFHKIELLGIFLGCRAILFF